LTVMNFEFVFLDSGEEVDERLRFDVVTEVTGMRLYSISTDEV